jgi:LuxR family maltose regulon positive regulatory protein
MRDGVERARADADFALAQLSRDSVWRPSALILRGVSEALLGMHDLAVADLAAGAHLARAFGGTDDVFIPLAELALLDAKRGDWLEAARRTEEARSLVDQAGLSGYLAAAIVDVAVARVALHGRRHADARDAMGRAHRLRPLLSEAMPWFAVQVGTELSRCHLALGEPDAARTVLKEATAVLRRRPDLGSLVEDVRDLGARIDAQAESSALSGAILTTAELRLLPYLATHLTVPEIAGRLFVTSHTVRSEAKSIYRKLDASSRSEAVDRAIDLGLLEPMFTHRSSVAV